MSQSYEAVVTHIAMCGSEIIVVRFSRPEGYRFVAGQWFRLTLLTEDGAQTKTFSHSSAPDDAELEMATRLSGSAFKEALSKLRPGDRVAIAGPGGRLALPPGARRLVALVGGVGVTPVRSLLVSAVRSGRTFDDACLIYGVRDSTCTLYLDEFERMGQAGIRTVTVVEHPEPDWAGETGFITASLVLKYVAEVATPVFLTAGPPMMVAAMEVVMDQLEVEPSRRIIEKFGIAG